MNREYPADRLPPNAQSPESTVGPSSFPTTHWSLVLNVGVGSESQARAALETLCRQYWYPLYTFARRHGRPHHDAEDCTQEFLARLLAAEGIARAEPARGRFRTFLLTAMQNFLRQEWHRTQAAKRGGGQAPLTIDAPADAEHRFAREPLDPGLTPEEAFDRAWAAELIRHVVGELRNEYERRGQAALFAVLAPLVWGDDEDASHAQLASQIGLREHAFTVALQRLRRRIGERLRVEIAQTVDAAAEVDAELHYLIAAATGAAQSTRGAER